MSGFHLALGRVENYIQILAGDLVCVLGGKGRVFCVLIGGIF